MRISPGATFAVELPAAASLAFSSLRLNSLIMSGARRAASLRPAALPFWRWLWNNKMNSGARKFRAVLFVSMHTYLPKTEPQITTVENRRR